jgi:phosphoenolpyruvate-protein kinase (PTS system EI component)
MITQETVSIYMKMSKLFKRLIRCSTGKTRWKKVFQGTSISPGMASGRAFIYTDILLRDHGLYTIRPSDFRDEYRRIEQAITDVRRELALSAERVQKELNAQIAGIFLSQGEILRDPELIKEIRRELESSLVKLTDCQARFP